MKKDAKFENKGAADLRRAQELHRGGRLGEAEALYRRVLAQAPKHGEALHYLGLLKAQMGDLTGALEFAGAAVDAAPQSAQAHLGLGHLRAAAGQLEAALASYDQALALRPDYPEALYSRGNALQGLKRHEEAVASYDKLLALSPDVAEALTNRGNALHDLKRYEEALASYDRALVRMPGVAMLHNNRGNTLREMRRFAEALASLDRALAIEPGYVEAQINRGNVLQDLGRFEEALACFDRVLAGHPGLAVAHHYRGDVLHDLKRYREALMCYDRALTLAPDYAEVLNSRGITLQELKKPAEAMACYERAIALNPHYVEALNNSGNALRDLGRMNDALVRYERAIAIKPEYVEALYNRGHAQIALKKLDEAVASFKSLLAIAPDSDFALGDMFHAQLQSCNWSEYAENVGRIVKAVKDGKKADVPFSFLAISTSEDAQLLCARTYVSAKCPDSGTRLYAGERYRHEKIRVAYLSADFYRHATAYLMAGLFERHDRSRFEITAISFGPDTGDSMRNRLTSAFDHFIDVREKDDLEVAALIRKLEIDIAVDLKGFTGDCRTGIFALRGAPIQVNYLGYPGTMGADYIDYLLADKMVIPENQQEYYSEKIAYLPHTYQVNDVLREIAGCFPTRIEAGLPERGFVFCSFNNNYKINPAIFDVWMRLLRRHDSSVLWLLEDNPIAAANLRIEAASRGVDSNRLIFAPRVSMENHLARHRLADLFLDTLPYNAHTTASDALWSGLPLVTCRGSTFAGRVAASLLNAVGLPELVTDTLEQYEALASKLADHPEMLSAVKDRLLRNRKTSPLFDTDLFRRHLEAAYVTMWEHHQRGEPPESFAVQPMATI